MLNFQMAALASPTPANVLHDSRRPSYRGTTRPAHARVHALQPITTNSTSHRHVVGKVSTGDSSDDEDLAPIKLSAEAQAILGEDNSQHGSDKENQGIVRRHEVPDSAHKVNNFTPAGRVRGSTPARENGSPVPRVVRVTSGPRPTAPAVVGRDGSFMYKMHEKGSNRAHEELRSAHTPAEGIRRVRVSGSRRLSRSPPLGPSWMPEGDRGESGRQGPAEPFESPVNPSGKGSPEEGQAGPSTGLRSRRLDENGAQSTMRVKRIGGGALLNKPLRRGMIRRASEEEQGEGEGEEEEAEDNHHRESHPQDRERSATPEMETGRRAPEPDLHDLPDDFLVTKEDSPHPMLPALKSHQELEIQETGLESEAPLSLKGQHALSTSTNRSQPTPVSGGSQPSAPSSHSQRKSSFKIPPLPSLPSFHNQENEPPPTFKRSKAAGPVLEVHEDDGAPREQNVAAAVSQGSPVRQPLAARSNNTPHRPAPAPPPKMSLIEAATSNAGSRNKKSIHYVLNGRAYRRLDCIGRGGSSRVFRIMAENYKIFALKRVSLEDADMAAIAGYKGEIELLKKLENVDRVIRLYDYEINEDKGILSVMMELGETDFNKMLNEQLKTENAKLDITFTRHYWKEMLECVQAVHDHDIVHSDLKPANFLLVKGQLKLIDFGIANAIQDNTVNVHRENQIGTPNYMSPESLVCHTPAAGAAAGTKLLKLGKPSDVWSLGCILYQMTYGQPPFAHITKQFERIMSIPNPKVEIQFPSTGIGGAVVPFGLIKTLRRCLTREQSLRPTIKELLSDTDPFLNPVAISPDMLGRVIGNVVSYCRRREEGMRARGEIVGDISCLPKDEEMKGWPWAFYEKLKQAQEEGTAW